MTGTVLFAIIDTLSILFIGDIMQHRQQLHSALMPGADSMMSASYDYSSYFRHVRRHIDAADFTVANMEFCLGGPPYTGYPSFSAPESIAEAAAEAGIDLFLCANNHICDRGRRGLASTFEKYDRIGIPVTGAYRDSASRSVGDPFITNIGGIKTAFINFTYGTNGIEVPEPFCVNMMDRTSVLHSMKKAEAAGAEIIIALPHWGDEYSTEADRTQREWARFLLDNGADAVIGSHPHVVQAVEFPTVYSLGNFISNMSLRNTELGLMYRLDIIVTTYGPFITGGEAIPVWCSRAGGYEDGYTVLPVMEFMDKGSEFKNQDNYLRMTDTYNRLKSLFENE